MVEILKLSIMCRLTHLCQVSIPYHAAWPYQILLLALPHNRLKKTEKIHFKRLHVLLQSLGFLMQQERQQ